MLSMTIVTQPQDTLEQEFTRLGKTRWGKHRLAAYPPGRGNRQRFTGAPPALPGLPVIAAACRLGGGTEQKARGSDGGHAAECRSGAGEAGNMMWRR